MEVVAQYKTGDVLKMKDKEVKNRKLRGMGMEYVTVTKAWNSPSGRCYDIKSHSGTELKMIPHDAFDFVRAKRVENEV